MIFNVCDLFSMLSSQYFTENNTLRFIKTNSKNRYRKGLITTIKADQITAKVVRRDGIKLSRIRLGNG